MTGILTVSGNEITDAVRAAGVSGDGLSDDGSFGVWPATTNLCTDGGFETNTTGWAPNGTNTLARSQAVTPVFGSWCAKATFNQNGSDGNCGAYTIAVAAAGTYTFSFFIYVPSSFTGALVELSVESFTGATGTLTASADLTKRDQWQRLTATVTIAAGDLTGALVLRFNNASPNGSFVYIDGVQIEALPYATPYIPTDGATATRAAGCVQAPAALLGDGAQFWAAFRVRYGWNAADRSSEFPWLFDWRTDTNNRISCAYLPTVSKWEIVQNVAGAQTGLLRDAGAAVRGAEETVIFQVTATQLMVSVAGSAFAKGSRGGLLTPSGTLFDIATFAGSTADVFGGDVLYTACGVGTLTDTDAAWLHSQLAAGTEPWAIEDLDASCPGCNCTAVMHFNDDTYIDEAFTIIDPDETGASRGLLPKLKVELDVTNQPTNPARVWTDATGDLRTISYRTSGRNDELQQTQPGTLTAVFDNRDAKYDPANSSGAGIKRRQWMRVRARWDTTDYPRWQGIIEQIAQSWPQAGIDGVATVTAADALKVANLYDLNGQTFVSQTSDERVAAVCALLGVTANLDDTGASTLCAATTAFSEGSAAATHLIDIETTENGLVFADTQGEITFQSRHYRVLNETVSQGVIGDDTGEIPYRDTTQVITEDAYICNVAYITPTNDDGSTGTTQTAVNTASQDDYFTSTPDAMRRTILVSSAVEAQDCANYLVNKYGDPSPRIPAAELVGAKAPSAWPVILAAANSTRLTFTRRAQNTFSEDVYVEQVNEEIAPGTSWKTSFQFSPATDQAMWVLGDNTNGALGETTRAGY